MLRNLEVSTVMVVGFEQKRPKMLNHVAELRDGGDMERRGLSKNGQKCLIMWRKDKAEKRKVGVTKDQEVGLESELRVAA